MGAVATRGYGYIAHRDIETLRELTNGRITSRAGAGRPTIPQSSSDSDSEPTTPTFHGVRESRIKVNLSHFPGPTNNWDTDLRVLR